MTELTRDTVLSHLKLVPVFDRYSRKDLKFLADRMSEEHQWKGTTLITQGQPNDRFFVILDGEVTVLRDDNEVNVLKAGQFFGEISLLRLEPATATVVTRASSSLLVLTHRQFQEAIRTQKHLARDVNEAAAKRTPG